MASVRKGAMIIEPILVTPDPAGDLVILEGHGRFTVYALAAEETPRAIRSLLGVSAGFTSWL